MALHAMNIIEQEIASKTYATFKIIEQFPCTSESSVLDSQSRCAGGVI